MRIIILFAIIFFLSTGVTHSQSKEIPSFKVFTQQVKNLYCIDSANSISEVCQLGLNGFNVRIYSAFLDVKKREFRLIGRVCVGNMADSPGLSDIEIFKATKKGMQLLGKGEIGRTTYDDKYIYNDGFFDITFTINQNESLFFYGAGYFLREFTVYKLLQ